MQRVDVACRVVGAGGDLGAVRLRPAQKADQCALRLRLAKPVKVELGVDLQPAGDWYNMDAGASAYIDSAAHSMGMGGDTVQDVEIKLGGADASCSECVLQQYVCWEGDEAPFFFADPAPAPAKPAPHHLPSRRWSSCSRRSRCMRWSTRRRCRS